LAVQHDPALRSAARVIYEEVYPSEEWAPTNFDDAERLRTVHYRQAVGAAMRARSLLAANGSQLLLFPERG
jgi:hypothetical protein